MRRIRDIYMGAVAAPEPDQTLVERWREELRADLDDTALRRGSGNRPTLDHARIGDLDQVALLHPLALPVRHHLSERLSHPFELLFDGGAVDRGDLPLDCEPVESRDLE